MSKRQEQYVKLKSEVNPLDIYSLNPWLIMVFGEFCAYAMRYNLPVIISSMIDEAPGRVSATHEEGRAIDVSSKGWDRLHIERIKFHLNSKYGKEFGTAPKDIKPMVLVHHDAGTGYHFHLQTKRFNYVSYEFSE